MFDSSYSGQEELLRELRRPSPESLMLHRDLERCKEELRQEQTLFAQQKQLLEARLKEEVSKKTFCACLITQRHQPKFRV